MAGFKIHNFDFNKLMEFAATAKGDVLLETPDGDVLNLKSRLTQLLALSSAIDWGNIGEATVVCKDIDDESRVFRLNLYGNDDKTYVDAQPKSKRRRPFWSTPFLRGKAGVYRFWRIACETSCRILT